MLLKYVDGIKVANVWLSLVAPQLRREGAANLELTPGDSQVKRRLLGYTEKIQSPVWTFEDIICVYIYIYIFQLYNQATNRVTESLWEQQLEMKSDRRRRVLSAS